MSSPTSTELPIVKKRGRPKTVNVDKKEYQKKYQPDAPAVAESVVTVEESDKEVE
jgi:hypothetical protein